MNVNLTEFEVKSNDVKHNIPNIIHFLPGCNDHQESWKDMNPDFIVISWDHVSIQKVIKSTDALCGMQLDVAKDDVVLSSILCYHYGGVVISKPEKCFTSLQSLLGHIPSTLLAVFALPGSSLLDTSIVISSAKISAFQSLIQYFAQAKQKNQSTPVVFRDFVKSSMSASNDGAIVCLHSIIKDKLTKAPEIKYNKNLLSLENMMPSSHLYRMINPSELSSNIAPWLTKLGKTESNKSSDTIGILVIDQETFNKDAPVPEAIQAVLNFQDVLLCDDAIVIVAHSPSGGISLDMMLLPQLTLMNAKEIYRSDHVVWKLSKK